jgi:bacterial/archaeal transporter family-2 protein
MFSGPSIPRRLRLLGALLASIIAGALVALQSRINGEFGLALGDGALAALLSFTTGFVALLVLSGFSRQAREGLRVVFTQLRSGDLPWWAILGGVGGGFLVLTQGLTAGVLGVALFTIAVVTGQSLGALWIDTRGLVGMPMVPLRPLRIFGVVIVLAGVITAVDLTPAGLAQTGWLFVLPLLAGVGAGFQQAVNGRVGSAAGSPLAATLINFGIGTTLLVVVFLVSWPFTGGPSDIPGSWWLWTGGLVGALFIAIQVATVRIVGVLGLGVSLVTGQLIGSIFLDAFVPVATSDVQLATIVGALVTLVGAIVVTVTREKPHPSGA